MQGCTLLLLSDLRHVPAADRLVELLGVFEYETHVGDLVQAVKHAMWCVHVCMCVSVHVVLCAVQELQ